jgi:hypothetical protein
VNEKADDIIEDALITVEQKYVNEPFDNSLCEEGICGIISLHHSGANLVEKVWSMAGHLADGETLGFSSVFGNEWAFAAGGWQAGGFDPITFAFQDEHLAIAGVADILNRGKLAARHRLAKDRTGDLMAALKCTMRALRRGLSIRSTTSITCSRKRCWIIF